MTTYEPHGWIAEKLEGELGPRIKAAIAALPPVGEYEQADPYYRLFMAQVDRRLLRMVGMTHRDLADTDSWSLYADGSTPREAAMAILEEQDGFDMLVDAFTLDGE